MNKFEVGDIVVCIDSFDLLYGTEKITKGQVYTVKKTRDRGIVVEGINVEFSKSRFVSISEYRIMKLKEIYDEI